MPDYGLPLKGDPFEKADIQAQATLRYQNMKIICVLMCVYVIYVFIILKLMGPFTKRFIMSVL